MTHNALVQVFLSVDFTTREQSDDSISDAKVSKRQSRDSGIKKSVVQQNLLPAGQVQNKNSMQKYG